MAMIFMHLRTQVHFARQGVIRMMSVQGFAVLSWQSYFAAFPSLLCPCFSLRTFRQHNIPGLPFQFFLCVSVCDKVQYVFDIRRGFQSVGLGGFDHDRDKSPACSEPDANSEAASQLPQNRTEQTTLPVCSPVIAIPPGRFSVNSIGSATGITVARKNPTAFDAALSA